MSSKRVFFVAWGFVLWVTATIFLRFLGRVLLDPQSVVVVLTFVVTVPLIAAATYTVYAHRSLTAAERPAAAACVVLPGILLDVFSLLAFGSVFPRLSSTSASADAVFAAWILWAYGLILLTGFFPQRLPRATWPYTRS